jgi:hypothetical protein
MAGPAVPFELPEPSRASHSLDRKVSAEAVLSHCI